MTTTATVIVAARARNPMAIATAANAAIHNTAMYRFGASSGYHDAYGSWKRSR